MDKTGYDKNGFRPVGNEILLELTNDDLLALESPHAEKSKVVAGKELFLGDDLAAEKKKAEQENRTFTVAGLSESLADKSDCPVIGDEVSLKAGTMQELVVSGKVYGCVQLHRVLCIHKEKINPKV
jgi:hypothetical protein